MSSQQLSEWTCDRCGKSDRFQYLPARWIAIESYPSPREKGRDNAKNYDLCPDCAASWYRWITDKAPE